MKRMLVFNPSKRVGIDEALAHPLFKDIRNHNVEVSQSAPTDATPRLPAVTHVRPFVCPYNMVQQMTAKEKVKLPFDDWESMDEPQLRYLRRHTTTPHHTQDEAASKACLMVVCVCVCVCVSGMRF